MMALSPIGLSHNRDFVPWAPNGCQPSYSRFCNRLHLCFSFYDVCHVFNVFTFYWSNTCLNQSLDVCEYYALYILF